MSTGKSDFDKILSPVENLDGIRNFVNDMSMDDLSDGLINVLIEDLMIGFDAECKRLNDGKQRKIKIDPNQKESDEETRKNIKINLFNYLHSIKTDDDFDQFKKSLKTTKPDNLISMDTKYIADRNIYRRMRHSVKPEVVDDPNISFKAPNLKPEYIRVMVNDEQINQVNEELRKKDEELHKKNEELNKLRTNSTDISTIRQKEDEIDNLIKAKNKLEREKKNLTKFNVDVNSSISKLDDIHKHVMTDPKRLVDSIAHDLSFVDKAPSIREDLIGEGLNESQANGIIAAALNEHKNWMKTVESNPQAFGQEVANDAMQKQNEQFQSKLRQQNLRYILPRFIERREKLVENTLNPNLLKGAFAI